MARLIFFIGPGGSGKSTICREIIKRFDNFRIIKLDDIADKHSNDEEQARNVDKIKSKIEELEKDEDSTFYLIDVGAYSQAYIENSFWELRKDFLACVYNNEEFCYENFCNRSGKEEFRKDKNGFIKREFGNKKRKELYELASIKILTNKSIEENILEVLNFILKRFYEQKQ